jgi:hypothetical protein
MGNIEALIKLNNECKVQKCGGFILHAFLFLGMMKLCLVLNIHNYQHLSHEHSQFRYQNCNYRRR